MSVSPSLSHFCSAVGCQSCVFSFALQEDLSKDDRKKKKKRPKREDEENDPAPPLAEPSPIIDLSSPPEKKRKKKPEKRTPEPEKVPSLQSTNEAEPLVSVKKEVKPVVLIPEVPRHFLDEECSSATCSHPVGEAVEWIQCDMCQRWFHFTCVGLQPAEAKAMECYACIQCRAAPSDPGATVDHTSSMDSISVEDSTAASMLLAVAQSGLPSSLASCFCEDSDTMDRQTVKSNSASQSTGLMLGMSTLKQSVSPPKILSPGEHPLPLMPSLASLSESPREEAKRNIDSLAHSVAEHKSLSAAGDDTMDITEGRTRDSQLCPAADSCHQL